MRLRKAKALQIYSTSHKIKGNFARRGKFGCLVELHWEGSVIKGATLLFPTLGIMTPHLTLMLTRQYTQQYTWQYTWQYTRHYTWQYTQQLSCDAFSTSRHIFWAIISTIKYFFLQSFFKRGKILRHKTISLTPLDHRISLPLIKVNHSQCGYWVMLLNNKKDNFFCQLGKIQDMDIHFCDTWLHLTMWHLASFDHVKVGPTPVLALHHLWRKIHMFLDILEFRVENKIKSLTKTVLVMWSQICGKVA